MWGEEPSWSVGKEGEMVGERGHTEAFDKGWGEAARAKGQGRSGLGCAALDGMGSQPPPSSTWTYQAADAHAELTAHAPPTMPATHDLEAPRLSFVALQRCPVAGRHAIGMATAHKQVRRLEDPVPPAASSTPLAACVPP